MNKNLFKYIIFIGVVFCFSILKVNAEDKLCTYGMVNTGDWKKKVTIQLHDKDNPIYLFNGASPLFTDTIESGGFYIDYSDEGGIKPDSSEDIRNYIMKMENNGCDYDLFISPYILNMDECEPILHIAYFTNTGCNGDADDVALYDDLALGAAEQHLGFSYDEEDGLFQNEKWSKVDKLLVLEKYKDDYEKFLVDGCSSFTSYLNKIYDSIKEKKGCDNNEEFDRLYKELNFLCDNYRSTIIYSKGDGTIAKGCQKACTNLRDTIDDYCQNDNVGGYCGSLGNGIVNWIFRIIRIIRYSIPALLIILSILDFIKAIAEEDESKVKEATKRFIRRLIAVVLLFVIPFILNFILNLFNIPGLNASNPFCAK